MLCKDNSHYPRILTYFYCKLIIFGLFPIIYLTASLYSYINGAEINKDKRKGRKNIYKKVIGKRKYLLKCFNLNLSISYEKNGYGLIIKKFYILIQL